MAADAIEDDLARRFRIDRPPTLLARKSSKARIGFSRMRSSRPLRGHSLAAPPQEAFAFHVPLLVPFFSNLWTAGRRREVPDLRLGDTMLVDLSENPVVGLDIPFDTLRFYITQVALDEMANEAGIRQVKGLYAPNFGARDLVMFGLAQALAGAMEQHGEGTAMFADCVALAFFSTGVPPYRWLTKLRVERAKELLKDPRCELADIALLCGFVDQSHFTRVFSRSEGYSPGRWRRLHRL